MSQHTPKQETSTRATTGRGWNRRRFLKLLGIGGLAAAAGGFALVRPHRTNPYYSGPVSDHFNGLSFFNPARPHTNTLGDLAKWRLWGRRAPWPDAFPASTDRPPTRVDSGAVRVSMIGHASILIQTRGLNVVTDPHYSLRASPLSFAGPARVNAPGIAFDDLPRIDIVLVSHNHYDHMDLPTLSRLWHRDRPRIIAPLGNDAIIRAYDREIAVESVDWGDALEAGNGVSIHAQQAHHWSARNLRDRRMALWAAYVIEAPEGNIYFAGDTGYGGGDHFRATRARFGGFRLALLPIGAYEPRWFMAYSHMNPAEAVQAMDDLNAERAMGFHWGTFQLTDEGVDAPRVELGAALATSNRDASDFAAPLPGGILEVV